jgi:DNA-3-methyladenine glycosylase I
MSYDVSSTNCHVLSTEGAAAVLRYPGSRVYRCHCMPPQEPPVKRCGWVNPTDPLMLQYHDREWGVPNHHDRAHFEFLVLEAAQAGLSWSIVLRKREGYRRAFSQFDPETVARYTRRQIQKLIADQGIIRNRLKIESAVRNAQAFLAIQEEFGSFDAYCWRFVDGRPKVNRWTAPREIPATSPESDAFSKDMKRRGFSFVGSTVMYAHMQAVGMVNDHLIDCFRYREVRRLARRASS